MNEMYQKKHFPLEMAKFGAVFRKVISLENHLTLTPNFPFKLFFYSPMVGAMAHKEKFDQKKDLQKQAIDAAFAKHTRWQPLVIKALHKISVFGREYRQTRQL